MTERNRYDAAPDRLPVSIQFEIANPAAGSTVDGVLGQGGDGFVVPAGYRFHPAFLLATSNAALSAGTADFNVTADGVELSLASVQLTDAIQRAAREYVFDAEPIGAGVVVGVSVITSAGYLPVTLDHDVLLVGELVAETYTG